jgi:hypothetical protein
MLTVGERLFTQGFGIRKVNGKVISVRRLFFGRSLTRVKGLVIVAWV